jgi:quercetin dioxygenase-like cupin family protein
MKHIPSDNRPFIPASHENPLAPGVLKRVLCERDDLQEGRVQMVNWARLAPRKSFAAHYHEDMQEIFVILRGSVRLSVDDNTLELNAGDAVIIDPGEVHQMWNLADHDAEYLTVGITGGTDGRTVVVAEQ